MRPLRYSINITGGRMAAGGPPRSEARLTLPLALAKLGLIDDYEFVGRQGFRSGAVVLRYRPGEVFK